mgnify:FL=1|jgi:hypothetical protein
MILDETERFSDMIEAFECDFSLAMNKNSKYSLKDLQETIEEDCNSKLKKDIDLLQELSFDLRHNNLRIVRIK